MRAMEVHIPWNLRIPWRGKAMDGHALVVRDPTKGEKLARLPLPFL